MLTEFSIKRIADFEFLVFDKLEASGIVHGFSTGRLDYSEENREEIKSALLKTLDVSDIKSLKQVHGDLIVDAARLGSGTGAVEGDGLISSLGKGSRIALAVKTADCMPALFVGRQHAAMIHAGWRGSAAGIIAKAVGLFPDRDFAVYIGPHARECCYEVGPEVFHAFGREPAKDRKISIYAEVKRQILDASDGMARVYESGVCTICSPDFHSFRRDGDKSGRSLNFVVSS